MPEPQAGADQPPGHLASRRQRRRSQSLHAAHPRAGTAHAQHQNRRVHHHDDRHGRIAPAVCPRTSAKFTTRLTGENSSAARWPSSIRRPSCWSRRKSGRIFSGAPRDLGIPLFLANARLSDRSYRGYRRFGFPVPPAVRLVCRRRRAKRRRMPRGCGRSAAGPKPSASSAT